MRKKKPKLLFVTYEYPFGGSETFIETEIGYLAAEFDTVWILPSRAVWNKSWLNSVRNNPRDLPNNCKVVFFPEKSILFFIRALWHSFAILSKSEYKLLQKFPNIIFLLSSLQETIKAGMLSSFVYEFTKKNSFCGCSYSYWKSPAAIALIFLKTKRVLNSVITRCHGGDLYNEVLKYPGRPYDHFAAEQGDLFLPISEHGVHYLIEQGFSKDKVLLSRLGVKPAEKPTLDSNDGKLRIVSCSNIIPVKRVDLLARALKLLTVPFIWTHFGDGFERNKVAEIVKDFSSMAVVIFPGRVSNEIVLTYYQENPVDVFVNVSESEGVPVSIMEALSAGIPCIVTDVGGVSEIVDATCGIVLNAEIDCMDLAKNIASVVENKAIWSEKRCNAYARGKERCTANVNYQQFAKILQRFCKG